MPAARNPNNPILSDSAVWCEDAHVESCVLEARYNPFCRIVACLRHAATDTTPTTPHCAPLRSADVGLLGYRAFSTMPMSQFLRTNYIPIPARCAGASPIPLPWGRVAKGRGRGCLQWPSGRCMNPKCNHFTRNPDV